MRKGLYRFTVIQDDSQEEIKYGVYFGDFCILKSGSKLMAQTWVKELNIRLDKNT